MDWNLFLTFVVLNTFNVIIQTVKSICTVKCGKGIAAIVNTVAYGLYTIVTVYMLCDLDLWLKAGVVAICNLIGVYVVKLIEEKSRKDKLWKVEMTVKNYNTEKLSNTLKELDIPFNYIEGVGKYTIFNVYCATQKQSATVRKIGEECKAKFWLLYAGTL